MSIEARQIQKTLYSYAAILNFTPSPQGLRAKFGACSVQNAQLLCCSATIYAWHKMQRIRPSWTVIAFSGFAHEHYKIQDGGDQEYRILNI